MWFSFLKRTPPGKWVCPICRDRSGASRGSSSPTADGKQQVKSLKVGEGPPRLSQKVSQRSNRPLAEVTQAIWSSILYALHTMVSNFIVSDSEFKKFVLPEYVPVSSSLLYWSKIIVRM